MQYDRVHLGCKLNTIFGHLQWGRLSEKTYVLFWTDPCTLVNRYKSLDFELAPYLCPFSLLSWFQKHKDQPLTPLGSACSGVAIYGPERAQNTKDMAEFSELICFDHNFLPIAVINVNFRQVIYNFPNLSIDILVDHILGHKWSCHYGHYGTIIYNHNYGRYGCLLKD